MRTLGSAVILVSHSKEVEKLKADKMYEVKENICQIK
jgi:hypothetical protein